MTDVLNGNLRLSIAALGLFLACCGTMWGMVSVHANAPVHDGAVPRKELMLYKEAVAQRLDRIDSRLDRIEAKLDRLLEGR